MSYTTINKSSLHMNTKTFTGNGGTQSITGVGFQPDMTWLKKRNGTANHHLVDSVRGVGYYLYPNLTNAQGGSGNSLLTSFNSDGFTLDSGADSNASGATGVSWNWKAGTTSGITQGSATITPSSYSINATAGFSIIKWQGTNAHASVPHGLGVAPKMIIIRRLESSSSWVVYHHSIGNTKRLTLDSNAAESGASGGWFNNTSPTADLFHVGTDGGSNGSTDNYIAYCFAEKTGYSKFVSYVGNGNADGTFIYTGFKPAFILLKHTTSAESWHLFDGKRANLFNPVNGRLQADSSGAEYTGKNVFDFVSNGFKLKDNNGAYNGSGSTYIYMAFAEAPLVGTNNVPCTAR